MRRLFLAALLLPTALGTSHSALPASGTSLIWARSADSSTLDPAEIEWGEDAKVSESLFETLVTFGADSVELVGGLAKSWKFSEDGKTLTFELLEGVKFHDGTDFDAEDVLFTFARLTDPNHPHKPKAVPYSPNFAEIESVTADGPHRVLFHLRHPSAVVLYNIALFSAGIVSPEAVKKHGDQWPRNPVGTGPYKLTRWDRDVRIVLDRFDDYHGTKSSVGRVIVVPVASAQTAIQKLQKGEVHVVDHPTLADVKPLQEDAATKVDLETSMNVCYLGFNLKKFPYSDLNFRQAVSLAIDRAALNQLVYFNLAEPASNIVPPAIWRDTCPTPAYEHNIEKAKDCLAKVKLESKTVELIHMTFGRPYVPEPLRVAGFIKDQLQKIGLDVRLTGFDKSAYSLETKKDDHPMFLLGWNADYPDPDNFFYPLLHGASSGDLNSSFFNDPAFNEAVSAAQSELDGTKRKALYAKAYARYRDELPTLPLVHVKQIVALSRKVDYNIHPFETRFAAARFLE